MNDILIGAYKQLEVTCPVYVNPQTRELYYLDASDMAYSLMGFELTNAITAQTTDDDYDKLLDGMPEKIIGRIFDGDKHWLLTDEGEAVLLPIDSADIEDGIKYSSYDDYCEYDGD